LIRWDCEDFSYFPQDDAELTDEEKTAFLTWAKEREEDPQNPYLLQDWDPEVWEALAQHVQGRISGSLCR